MHLLLLSQQFCPSQNNRKPSKLTHRWQEAERSTQYSYIWSHTIMRTNTSKTKVLPPRNLTSAPVCVEPCVPPPPFCKAGYEATLDSIFVCPCGVCSSVGLDFCLPLRRPSYSTLHCGERGEGGGRAGRRTKLSFVGFEWVEQGLMRK